MGDVHLHPPSPTGGVGTDRGRRGVWAPVPARVPPALRPGETVALVSPCGPVLDHAMLDEGIAVVRSWGLEVMEGAHARSATGHLAGRDAQRAADVNGAIADPQVRAVWVTRGGYGLTRILDRIAWDALADDPKIVIGFSDVTALLVTAWRRSGLVTVHGHFAGRLAVQPLPVRARLRALLTGDDDGPGTLAGARLAGTPPTRVRAPLVGGNLTVLAALAGTPDALDARGCVLLLEEVGEAPYRVDRLLTQLRNSGALDGVAGIALGAPVHCDPPTTRPSATFDEVVSDHLADLGVPVVAGLPIGHMADHRAALHGGDVTLDGQAGTVTPHARLRR